MLLVIAYSRDGRESLRNVCRAHPDTVVGQFGRVALFEETEFGAFQVLRLREKHGDAIQIERTIAFNEYVDVPGAVREAAITYENREVPAMPYAQFAKNTSLPSKAAMKSSPLDGQQGSDQPERSDVAESADAGTDGRQPTSSDTRENGDDDRGKRH